MCDHLPTPLSDRDHWEAMAVCEALTIQGQRLVAQEIGAEVACLWHRAMGWIRGLAWSGVGRNAAPPV